MASTNNATDLSKTSDKDKSDGWTISLENLYRYQTAGYRDAESYRKDHGTNVSVYTNGMIKSLRTTDSYEITFPNSGQLFVREQVITAFKRKNLSFEYTEFAMNTNRQKPFWTLNETGREPEVIAFYGPNGNYSILLLPSPHVNHAYTAAELLRDSLPKIQRDENRGQKQFPIVWSEVYTCTTKSKGSEPTVVKEEGTLTYYSFAFKKTGETEQLECTVKCVSGNTEVVLIDTRTLNLQPMKESRSVSERGRAITSSSTELTSSIETEYNDKSVTLETQPVVSKKAVSNRKLGSSHRKDVNLPSNRPKESALRDAKGVPEATGAVQNIDSKEGITAYYSTNYSRYKNFSDAKYMESLDMYMQKENIGKKPIRKKQEEDVEKRMTCPEEKNPQKNDSKNGLQSHKLKVPRKRQTQNANKNQKAEKNQVYYISPSHYGPQLESKFHCPRVPNNTPRRLQSRSSPLMELQNQNDTPQEAQQRPDTIPKMSQIQKAPQMGPKETMQQIHGGFHWHYEGRSYNQLYNVAQCRDLDYMQQWQLPAESQVALASCLPMAEYSSLLPSQPPSSFVPMNLYQQSDVLMHERRIEFPQDAANPWAQPIHVQIPVGYDGAGYYNPNPGNFRHDTMALGAQQFSQEEPKFHYLNDTTVSSDQLCTDIEGIQILDWKNPDTTEKQN